MKGKGISASRMEQKRSGVTVTRAQGDRQLRSTGNAVGRGSDRLWSSWELEELSPDTAGHRDSRKGTG